MSRFKGIKLYLLISTLIVFVVSASTTVHWIVSMNTYEKALSEKSLNNNYSYARKLTSSTKYQLNYMLENIVAISDIAGNHDIDENDVTAWFSANENQFNAIFITDANGVIQFVELDKTMKQSDDQMEKGMTLTSDVFKRVLREKRPFISDPYYGTTNQLVTLISAPIFNADTGIFEGIVGGTIYMEDTNVLKNLLANHDYDDMSYVFVVDQEGKLIYHPNEERLGEDVSDNEVIQRVLNKESGSMVVKNTQGDEFFAGYSFVECTGWGIIAQTPTTIIEEGKESAFWRMVMISLPLIVLVFVIGGLLGSLITRPINQLVSISKRTVNKEEFDHERETNIHSPIYEVRELNKQIIEHLRILDDQARIDGLTQIANRRTFDQVVTQYIKREVPFSLILLDIDFFKKVNDTYGHLVGDEVLKFLTREMEHVVGKEHMCFRYGGEEFAIVVKNSDPTYAYELAESLRKHIAETVSPSGEAIEISLGVTTLKDSDTHVKDLVNRADAALYHSKKTGRNKTSICNDNQLVMDEQS